ncbi:hypothetical protein ACJW30_05G215700 [Castanea mollissima]
MGQSLVKCLLWGLIVLVHLHGHRGCFEEERMGLLEIKEEFVRSTPNATIQESSIYFLRSGVCHLSGGHILPSWVYDHKSECCEWERVTCNSTTGHVTHLSLHNIWEFDIEPGFYFYSPFDFKHMVWFLDVSLFESFKELRSLDLSLNAIGGWIEHKGSESLLRLNKLESLDLDCNIFNWSIIHSLRLLTSLKSLNLSYNALEGSLTTKGLCGLKKLEELDLSQNSFEGTLPSCLYNLTSLQQLDLNGNQFRGNISSLIVDLTSLKYIDLSYNLFEGLSFSLFANLSKLESFQFRCDNKKVEIEMENSNWVPLFKLESLVISNCSLNKLSHQLMTFLFHQHSLRKLDLSHNGLKGPFPDWLFRNNTRLKSATLNHNSFTGHFHLSLCLNSTYVIDVSNNQLNGKLQQNIGEILPNIRYLKLSDNSFTGSLPSSFGNMSLLDTLDVSLNNFSGEVPKDLFVGCSMLWILVLSNNYFDGHLDWVPISNLTRLFIFKINHNQFSGAMPNKLPNFVKIVLLAILDVSNNKMSGRIPTWICNLTNIGGILMQNNNFEGQIPCETTTYEFLDLSHNLLDGSLPLWSSTQLKHLHLEENNFSGSIPEPFLNMSELRTLDISDNKLSGSIPSAISKASNLRILLLGGNQLSGNISTQLCQLTNITLMDLSRNLFFGTIPCCFGHTLSFGIFEAQNWARGIGSFVDDAGDSAFYYLDVEINFVTKYRLSSYKDDILTYMSGLDLSCNNLTGEIPLELGQLQRIHALNLSHNQLTGSIPKSFSDLTNVESLDLSHNRLSGEIPPQLIELTFLEVFSVAYNNLSGRTPDMKAQFGTFDASSYDGNPFLCGLPLEKNCTRRDDSPTPMHSSDVSDEKWYKVDQTVFFTSFLVTYIMFCVGVASSISRNFYCNEFYIYVDE